MFKPAEILLIGAALWALKPRSNVSGTPIEDEDIIIQEVPPGNPRSGKLFVRNGKLYVVRKIKPFYQFNNLRAHGSAFTS